MEYQNAVYVSSLGTSLKHDVTSMSTIEVHPDKDPSIHLERLCELQADIKDSKILVPGTREYEEAIFIGNLLYRMQTPATVVHVRSIRDVQATIRFARQYNVKVTVKNGGHSYAGFCLNRGGIVIDLKEMNEVTYDKDAMTITLQAGAIWKDAYALFNNADTWDNIVVGGQCPGVGVSGFTLGAGLSPFSRSYGLGIDNLLEMTIVTADGKVVTVGEHSTDRYEKDLFWALRGGGGGNFGVTVEFKSRLHKLKDCAASIIGRDISKSSATTTGRVCCGEIGWKLPEEQDRFDSMMRTFNDWQIPDEVTVDAIWLFDDKRQLWGQMTMLFNGPMDKYIEVCARLLAWQPSLNNVEEMHYADWAVQQEGFDVTSVVYHHHASFILPEHSITDEVTRKFNSLMLDARDILNAQPDPPAPAAAHPSTVVGKPYSNAHLLWDHIGGASSRIGASETAFPWREGHYVTTIKTQWVEPSQAKAWYEFTAKCKRELQQYAVNGTAAYINYIDDTVPNWQEAYYGCNYPRLQAIKKHWDPEQFWRFDMAIEGNVARAREEQNSMKPQPGTQLPVRWTDIAVQCPETLYDACSVDELLQAHEKLRQEHAR